MDVLALTLHGVGREEWDGNHGEKAKLKLVKGKRLRLINRLLVCTRACASKNRAQEGKQQ